MEKFKINFNKIKNCIFSNFTPEKFQLSGEQTENIKNGTSLILNEADRSISLFSSTEFFPKPLKIAFVQNFFNNILMHITNDKKLLTDLIIIIDEIVSNIIEHSYNKSDNISISFELLFLKNKIIFKIKDSGPFGSKLNIQSEGNYNSNQMLARTAMKTKRGMGIYMIKKITDGIKYETMPDNSNQLTLIKKINKSSLAFY